MPQTNSSIPLHLPQKQDNYISIPSTIWRQVRKHFGLSKSLKTHLYARSAQCKAITYISEPIKRHFSVGAKINIVCSGINLFEYSRKEHSYQIAQVTDIETLMTNNM